MVTASWIIDANGPITRGELLNIEKYIAEKPLQSPSGLGGSFAHLPLSAGVVSSVLVKIRILVLASVAECVRTQ